MTTRKSPRSVDETVARLESVIAAALDTFAKMDASWYLAERKLLLGWSETRPSVPGT